MKKLRKERKEQPTKDYGFVDLTFSEFYLKRKRIDELENQFKGTGKARNALRLNARDLGLVISYSLLAPDEMEKLNEALRGYQRQRQRAEVYRYVELYNTIIGVILPRLETIVLHQEVANEQILRISEVRELTGKTVGILNQLSREYRDKFIEALETEDNQVIADLLKDTDILKSDLRPTGIKARVHPDAPLELDEEYFNTLTVKTANDLRVHLRQGKGYVSVFETWLADMDIYDFVPLVVYYDIEKIKRNPRIGLTPHYYEKTYNNYLTTNPDKADEIETTAIVPDWDTVSVNPKEVEIFINIFKHYGKK